MTLLVVVSTLQGLLATSQDQSGAGFIDQQAKLSKQEVDTSEPSTLLDFKHGESNQLHVFGSPYRGLEEEQQGTEAVATEELAE